MRRGAVLAIALAAGAEPGVAQGVRPEPAAELRRYTAYRASPGISVDGRLNEDAWSAAPWTASFQDIRGAGHPVPPLQTGAKLLWDERYLYVAARLQEPHLWATLTERDAIVYRDHDFEVFVDPDGDGRAYYEFEINALGTMFDLYLDRPYRSGGRAFIEWDARGLRWAVQLQGTLNDPGDEDEGWTVELAIPWVALTPPDGDPSAPETAAVRSPPEHGDEWRMNFSRVKWPLVIDGGVYRKEREPVDWSDHPEDNWVWSPQGEIDMHIPSRWGIVRFSASPPPGGHE